MLPLPLLLYLLALACCPDPADRAPAAPRMAATAPAPCSTNARKAARDRAWQADPHARMLAIADMTRPSTEERLEVVDLCTGRTMLRTYVAHGQGSGGLMAERFGNEAGSHLTSLGLYRVGPAINSPRHGSALLLFGLDAGLNDRAREREIIIHGADYAGASYIATHGRLGRSWGCPAVPQADMEELVRLLADGGLLYVHHGTGIDRG